MVNELQIKRIEKTISHISAVVSDALEMTQNAKALSVHSEAMLINAQQEFEELYMSLGGASEY